MARYLFCRDIRIRVGFLAHKKKNIWKLVEKLFVKKWQFLLFFLENQNQNQNCKLNMSEFSWSHYIDCVHSIDGNESNEFY